MERIRFFNAEDVRERITVTADINRIDRHVLKLVIKEILPRDEVFSSGFEVVDENNMGVSGNYYKPYTTIYRKMDDESTILLSEDGSVYKEPELTEEELEAKRLLDENKNIKIMESKQLLAEYLETHPLVSDCHGGVKAKYTVTAEKQALMSSNYLSYTIAKTLGVTDLTLTWNAAGCECEVWTEEEYAKLILQISNYVKPRVSLQQTYEVEIKKCKTQRELDNIVITYD